jgi:hypothetical protein
MRVEIVVESLDFNGRCGSFDGVMYLAYSERRKVTYALDPLDCCV